MVIQQDTGAVVSFHCSACGRCCNSPPQLTRAELFRHQDRFVGAIGLRRVRSAGNAHAAHATALATEPAPDPERAAVVESYLAI